MPAWQSYLVPADDLDTQCTHAWHCMHAAWLKVSFTHCHSLYDAGTSTLTIRETQNKTWHEDGSLTVTSEPILDFVGGSKFTTRAEFRVETDGPDCKVVLLPTQGCRVIAPCVYINGHAKQAAVMCVHTLDRESRVPCMGKWVCARAPMFHASAMPDLLLTSLRSQ